MKCNELYATDYTNAHRMNMIVEYLFFVHGIDLNTFETYNAFVYAPSVQEFEAFKTDDNVSSLSLIFNTFRFLKRYFIEFIA